MLRDCSSSSSSSRKQHSHHQSIAAAAPATMAAASPTFSLFFPLPNTNAYQCAPADVLDDDSHSSITTSPSSPSSSTGSVDCTLSLGTPSSRRAAAESAKQRPPCLALPSRVAVSWDVAAAPADQSCCRCPGGSRPSPAAASKSAAHEQGKDPALVHRRCANCGTTSTPLWRNGPRGPKSLCNACGIRFKKKERRAAATATSAMDQGGCGYLAQYGAAAAAAEMAYYGGCEGPALPCGDVADAVAVPAQAAAFAFAAVWPERMTLFQYN